MKKQFDISMRPQIEIGEYKVITKSGQEVRIVCWDMNTSNGTLLVALVKGIGGEFEKMRSYTLEGKCKSASEDASLFVITPEPELTEFEKACKRMMLNWCESNDWALDNDFVREEAAKLEEIAKKWFAPKYDATKVDEQLIGAMVSRKKKESPNLLGMSLYEEGLRDMYKQFAEELDVAFKHQDTVIFDNGYDKGRKDANEELPRWKNMHVQLYGEGLVNLDSPFIADNVLILKGYCIDIQELYDKLPKEE